MSLGCKCVEAFCCYVTFIQAIIVFYGIDCVVIKYGAELMWKCEVGPFSISNDARCRRCGFFFPPLDRSCDDNFLFFYF